MHGPPGLFFVLDKDRMSERVEEERSNYRLGTQEEQQLPFLRQYHPLEVEDLARQAPERLWLSKSCGLSSLIILREER